MKCVYFPLKMFHRGLFLGESCHRSFSASTEMPYENEKLLFSSACSPDTVHMNQLFRIYQRNISEHNWLPLVSARNTYKCVLNDAKLLFSERMIHCLVYLKFGCRDYQQLCKRLDSPHPKENTGPDKIPVIVLKNTNPELYLILGKLFNR